MNDRLIPSKIRETPSTLLIPEKYHQLLLTRFSGKSINKGMREYLSYCLHRFYHRALSIDPNEENLLYNLARAYLGVKRQDEAVKVLEKALKIRPDFKEAHILLEKLQTA